MDRFAARSRPCAAHHRVTARHPEEWRPGEERGQLGGGAGCPASYTPDEKPPADDRGLCPDGSITTGR